MSSAMNAVPDLTGFESHFKPGFQQWLHENVEVWNEFEAMANKVADAGWKRYSARTIVEVMVHHSAVREKNSVYKIGNDRSPDLARAYAVRHPHRARLFEYRRPMSDDFVRAVEMRIAP